MDFLIKFIHMICLLFIDVDSYVNMNELFFASYKIERRICQGCPFVLYSFIIIAKTFNVIITNETKLNSIYDIKLSIVNQQ